MSYSTDEKERRTKLLKKLSKELNRKYKSAKFIPSVDDIGDVLGMTQGFWGHEFTYFVTKCTQQYVWPPQATVIAHIDSMMTFAEYEAAHPPELANGHTEALKVSLRQTAGMINGPERRERMRAGIAKYKNRRKTA